MMAELIKAMGSKAILRGILVGVIVGVTVAFIGRTYMLLNNIDISTITNMIQEFSLGKELIKFITSSIS